MAVLLFANAACGSSGSDARGFSDFDGGAPSGDRDGGGDVENAGGFGNVLGGSDSGAVKSDECTKMDIVFVVDNSLSMNEEHLNLIANFPKFGKVIESYKTKSGLALEYRLAVTTTDDTKEAGKFLTGPSSEPRTCLAGPDRPWLERGDVDVVSAFGCRAQVGVQGSDVERPLESLWLSLTTAAAANSSKGDAFLRRDALLAFVVLTDEDEGGRENKPARPVSEYIKALDAIKAGRGRWASAVIAGQTACESTGLGNAIEATRLKSFTHDVGKNGVFSSICAGDLTEGLTQALATFDQACKDFPPPVK